MKILDGTGKGYEAKVDSDHRLHTTSVSNGEMANAIFEDEQGFAIATPVLTITTTGGLILWFYNSSTTLHFMVHRLIGSWNGGSTNYNRVCELTMRIGSTAPSGNLTAGSIRNLKSSSGQTATASAYYWDEVGDGMTGSTPGVYVDTVMLSSGFRDLILDGTIALGPGHTLGFEAKSMDASAGECSLLMSGYFK